MITVEQKFVEQLTHYQPFGVKLIDANGNVLEYEWIVYGYDICSSDPGAYNWCFDDEPKGKWRPLLHSLDKIDKVVVHEGKTLLELINENKPTQFVREIRFDEDDLYSHENWPGEDNFFYSHGNNPTNWPHWIVQLLYKYHFDVHNLIPRGLAIEKS